MAKAIAATSMPPPGSCPDSRPASAVAWLGTPSPNLATLARVAVIVVFLGGALGTSLRMALDAGTAALGWPVGWSTVLVNVLGSFLLGVVISRLPARAPRWLRAGLGAGLLGGFTTFSAVTVLLVVTPASGGLPLAVGQLVLTLFLGVAAAMTGLATGPGRLRVSVVSEDE